MKVGDCRQGSHLEPPVWSKDLASFIVTLGTVNVATILGGGLIHFAPRPESITLAVSNKTARSSIMDKCLM